MIPKDLYKAQDDNDEEELNSRYFKHRKMPIPPDEKKLLSKKKRDEKYGVQRVSMNISEVLLV